MSDFVNDQWTLFSERLRNAAQFLGADDPQLKEPFNQDAERFLNENSPETYPELLALIAKGTELAKSWQQQSPVSSATDPTKHAITSGVEDASEMAYQDSENHESMPVPNESMAQQASDAKDI